MTALHSNRLEKSTVNQIDRLFHTHDILYEVRQIPPLPGTREAFGREMTAWGLHLRSGAQVIEQLPYYRDALIEGKPSIDEIIEAYLAKAPHLKQATQRGETIIIWPEEPRYYSHQSDTFGLGEQGLFHPTLCLVSCLKHFLAELYTPLCALVIPPQVSKIIALLNGLDIAKDYEAAAATQFKRLEAELRDMGYGERYVYDPESDTGYYLPIKIGENKRTIKRYRIYAYNCSLPPLNEGKAGVIQLRERDYTLLAEIKTESLVDVLSIVRTPGWGGQEGVIPDRWYHGPFPALKDHDVIQETVGYLPTQVFYFYQGTLHQATFAYP